MYEAKYRKYITNNTSRFAETDEVISVGKPFDPKVRNRVSGIPLYYDGSTLYVDNEDNHTAIIGPTGCKKTRVVALTTLATIIESGESAVVNDPKGELYRRTAKRAKECGAKVYVVNFRNPSQSHFWNPLSVPYRFYETNRRDKAVQAVADFTENIMSAAKQTTVEVYWAETAQAYLSSCTLLLMRSVPKDFFNLRTLIPICYQDNRRNLEILMQCADLSGAEALGLHSVLDLEADRTRSCVFSTLLSALRPVSQNEAILDMLSGNSFQFESLAEQQTIIYIIYPDEKNSLNFLVNLFMTQCYETLVCIANTKDGDRLPVRVNFVLDEFSNLPAVSNFANRISEARSKNIRYFLFMQSFGQLKEKYKDCADTILANCNNWICFGLKDMDFLYKISSICGRELDYNGIEHDLITPSQMQHLQKGRDSAEVLLIKQGLHPFVTKLPDFDFLPVFYCYESSAFFPDKEHVRVNTLSPDMWVEEILSGKFSIR